MLRKVIIFVFTFDRLARLIPLIFLFDIMNIIKLNAINSTNDYLKNLASQQHLDNFTVVVAEHQTAGRGQMGSTWLVEYGKNLTFSVLIKDLLLDINSIFNLNVAVTLGVLQALEDFSITGLSVKWPNDILAGNKKIGGILIENSIKPGGEIYSIVGIGLNVNQINFAGLPKASSLKVVTGQEHDKDIVLNSILESLKQNTATLLNTGVQTLWDLYHRYLYKIGVPMPFESSGRQFMGIIRGVASNGHLEVSLEDGSLATYGLKEVRLLY